jgi:hypothetical protein
MSGATTSVDGNRAMRLTVEVWHPGCWKLETTRQTAVGLLGYGCYSHDDGTTTTAFTLYADDTSVIDNSLASKLSNRATNRGQISN